MRIFLLLVVLVALNIFGVISNMALFYSIVVTIGICIFGAFTGAIAQVVGLEPNDAEREKNDLIKDMHEMEREKYERWKRENDI